MISEIALIIQWEVMISMGITNEVSMIFGDVFEMFLNCEHKNEMHGKRHNVSPLEILNAGNFK
jgi:hypothetical protein